MYGKAEVGGHPVHLMLVALPVASDTGALVGFVVYVANGHQFWLNPRDRPRHRGRRECGACRPSGVR